MVLGIADPAQYLPLRQVGLPQFGIFHDLLYQLLLIVRVVNRKILAIAQQVDFPS